MNDRDGSHHCECYEGYTLNEDKKTCSGKVYSTNSFIFASSYGGETDLHFAGREVFSGSLKHDRGQEFCRAYR